MTPTSADIATDWLVSAGLGEYIMGRNTKNFGHYKSKITT